MSVLRACVNVQAGPIMCMMTSHHHFTHTFVTHTHLCDTHSYLSLRGEPCGGIQGKQQEVGFVQRLPWFYPGDLEGGTICVDEDS